MRGHIHRDAIDISGKVSAMIQIKAAQEVLVSFTRTTMLSGKDTGDNFQYFTITWKGAVFKLRLINFALWCRTGYADKVFCACIFYHKHFIKFYDVIFAFFCFGFCSDFSCLFVSDVCFLGINVTAQKNGN